VHPELWPNGLFTFEHVQYFSPKTLEFCLACAGFEIVASEIHTAELPYPVISIVARQTAPSGAGDVDPTEFDRAVTLVAGHQETEMQTGWKRIEDQILPRLDRYRSICIWGAGIHTSQLLARTNVSERALRFIVDSDRQKIGHRLGGLEVISPSRIDEEKIEAVVISTRGSESAVYESTRELRDKGIDVIRLYPELHSGSQARSAQGELRGRQEVHALT
jgi:hypothetical protein